VRPNIRISLATFLALAAFVLAASPAQAALGIEVFFAGNCKVNTCKKEVGETPAEEKAKAEAEGFTQAGGHPNFGVTDFTVDTFTEGSGHKEPTGVVTHVRTDVAPGVSTNPEAVPKCSFAEFGEETLPGSGLFTKPNCPEAVVGEEKVVVYAGSIVGDLPLEGTTYNLVQANGLSSETGSALLLPTFLTKAELEKAFAEEGHPLGEPTEKALEEKEWYSHTLIEGNVEWGAQAAGTGKADYHDYFEVKVSPSLPLISSRLIFKGNIGTGGYLTNPTSCTGVGPQTTTTLTLTPKEGSPVKETATTPIGSENCGLVPFLPTFALTPETTQSDQPDGITTTVALPHNSNPEELDSSQLRTASVTLPEGMTLNPSAAAGLEACTPAQARIKSEVKGVACPAASEIGTVTLNVPGLPAGSLEGKIYLGGPESGPITGPPYTIYVDAESERYGISVRLQGSVTPNEETGRVTTSFANNPEQPFSSFTLHFKGETLAPIANPLTCGTATTETILDPYTGTPAQSPSSSFVVDSNDAGAPCASPLPFALSQSTQNQSANAGGYTSFTVNLARADGQQYLRQVRTVLPAGLVAAIPKVTQCGEAQANAGTCPSASQIGTATVTAGAGATPYQFSGPVYLTGPYNGAPFGLSIAVPAVAGPFNLGTVVTRATVNVDPTTARVIVASVLPTIVKGVPLRLRTISVAVNKQGYLFNPTNCGILATESLLTSTFKATQSLSSPLQLANCDKLAFKPSFKSASTARTSKANGASLETTINQAAGQANLKSVVVQLPKQLPSRLTTLQKACPAATFEANPYRCPAGSYVGGARANTPTLPGKMTGPAVLVSHGGAAFPDLDLVLEANGVRVIVVGNTDIKKGITTTSFKTTPDVPVTSVTVNLPVGPHSALAANGNLCAKPLTMPTTITGQNGKVVKQKTKIRVRGCGVRVAGKKVVGNVAYLTVQTYAPGRISGSGSNLATVYRHLRHAQKKASLKVPLSSGGRRKGRPLRVRVRVGFFPKKRGEHTSVAYTTVTFR
jgi:hypothetical protein